jgi:hypothetical protein
MASPTKETWKKRDRRDAKRVKRRNKTLRVEATKKPRVTLAA